MELESEVEEAKAAAAVAVPMAAAATGVVPRGYEGSPARASSGEARRIAELERKLAEQSEP